MINSRPNVSLVAAGLFGAALALASTQALSACKSAQDPSSKSSVESKEEDEEGEEGDEEESVDLAKLPEPVRAAAEKQFGKLDGCKASSESEHGAKIYEVVGKGGDGMYMSLNITSSGLVFEIERETKADALPGEVRATLSKEFGGATMKKADVVEERFYEVQMSKADKKFEVKLSATGRVMKGKE
jgi:hypothetical protein